MPRIDLVLHGRTHPILIERGLARRAGEIMREFTGSVRALVVMDARVAQLRGDVVLASLADSGIDPKQHSIEAVEANKTLAAVRGIYDAMAVMQLERGEPVIALGGGLVGDVAGFAAATWHRGVPLVQMPTTLLAMVDASIGGKTGVNLELPAEAGSAMGKNLVGAFHQPLAVMSDPDMLKTLDLREVRCGLAECIKHAMIADAALLTWIESQFEAIVHIQPAVMEALIERCARIKCTIVQEDERETGRRALLNLGHTFAHAIEPIAELDLKHGEAVAIGLIAAMHAAVQTMRMSQVEADRVRSVIERVGLPVRMRKAVDVTKLMSDMGHDKKVVGGKLRLILPHGIGAAEIVEDAPFSVIEDAWRGVGAVK